MKISNEDFYRTCMGITGQNSTHPLNWFNISSVALKGFKLPKPLEDGVIKHWDNKIVYCIIHPDFHEKISKNERTNKGYKGIFKAGKNFKTSKVNFKKINIPIEYVFICAV